MSRPKTSCPLHFVVIGDSVAGIGCAFTLAFVGHKVTVLEKLGKVRVYLLLYVIEVDRICLGCQK